MIETSETKINADIILKEPYGGIRFGTDALLLADFASKSMRKGKCIDLGTGSGVIPLLCLALGVKTDFVGLEIQEPFARVAVENASANNFSERFSVICGDALDYKSLFESGRADYCISNPPYMRSDCGRDNESPSLSIARREIKGGIELFCEAAGWALKSGGDFYVVYRPDRLVSLFCAMRNNKIEPKRLRAVVPSAGRKPSLVLVEGKKDGKEGISFEENLYVYTDSSHTEQSSEMKEIYKRFDNKGQ